MPPTSTRKLVSHQPCANGRVAFQPAATTPAVRNDAAAQAYGGHGRRVERVRAVRPRLLTQRDAGSRRR